MKKSRFSDSQILAILNRLLKNGFNSLLMQAKDGLPEDQAS